MDKAKTDADLLAEILQDEPDFKDETNVRQIYPNDQYASIDPIPLGDLLKMAPVPIEYMMYPILPKQGICFIYAAAGVGKTMFTLNLAYAIAAGNSFLNYKCPLPRKVLYVDAEMAFNEIHQRILSIDKMHGGSDFYDNFLLMTPDKIAPCKMPKIDDPKGQTFYTQLLIEGAYDVVVFDNLSMLSTFDENHGEGWKMIQDWLLTLRAIGKSVFIVHHAGKDKTQYRGTSKLLDCANTAISLQSLNSDELEDESVIIRKFKVEYQKNRGFSGRDALPFEISLECNNWQAKSIEQNTMDRVIDRFKVGMTQRDIAAELSVSQPYVNKLLAKARKLKLITSE